MWKLCYQMLKNSTFSFRMLTSKSRMLVDGEICCSLSSSGSTLPNQEVMSARSELSLCHCSRSCLMLLSSLLNLGALSSSHRWITPAHSQCCQLSHFKHFKTKSCLKFIGQHSKRILFPCRFPWNVTDWVFKQTIRVNILETSAQRVMGNFDDVNIPNDDSIYKLTNTCVCPLLSIIILCCHHYFTFTLLFFIKLF